VTHGQPNGGLTIHAHVQPDSARLCLVYEVSVSLGFPNHRPFALQNTGCHWKNLSRRSGKGTERRHSRLSRWIDFDH
jgi:hypothetical protein